MLTITKTEARRLWRGLTMIIPHKNSVPVLRQLRLSLSPTGCTIAATDLEQLLIGQIQAETPVTDERSFLMDADDFKAVATAKGKGLITFVPFEHQLEIVSNVDDLDMNRVVGIDSVNEWPTDFGEIDTQPCTPDALMNGIATCLQSASTDQTRYTLCGCYLDAETQTVVGTDGRRLMQQPVDNLTLPMSAIVPTTKILKKGYLATGGEGALGLADNDGTVMARFVSDSWDYRVKTIDGQYPNYQQVIPDGSSLTQTIELAESDCTRIASACRQFPKTKGDPTISLYADATLVILLHESEAGITHVMLNASTAEVTEPLLLTMNRTFLLDGLCAGFQTLHISDATKPIRFTNPDGGLYLVMPIRNDNPQSLTDYVASLRADTNEQSPEPATSKKETTPMPTTPDPIPAPKLQATPAPAEAIDPLDELMALSEIALEKLKDANKAVRDMKTAAKRVKRQRKTERKEFKTITSVAEQLTKLAA